MNVRGAALHGDLQDFVEQFHARRLQSGLRSHKQENGALKYSEKAGRYRTGFAEGLADALTQR
jgi:hypothetical protein